MYLDANNLCGYAMSKFFQRNEFNRIDPKDFVLNKYTSSSSKNYVLEVDLEYSKGLRESHNDYINVKRCPTTNEQLLIFTISLLAMLKY